MLSHGLRSISESVCVMDLTRRIIYVNPAFLRTFGYTQKELVGKDFAMVWSASNPSDVVGEILPATLRGGWQGELLNRRKDDTEFPVFLTISGVLDDHGKPVALIASATDITLRKRAAEELRLSEERYRTLVEQASDIIYRAPDTSHSSTRPQ